MVNQKSRHIFENIAMRDQRKLKRTRGGYSILNYKLPTINPQNNQYEKHMPFANFEGPNTRIKWRMQQNIKPTSNTDAGARQHDIDYFNIANRLKRNAINRQQAIQQVKASDAKLVKVGLRNMMSVNPVEKTHAIAAATGVIGKQALQQSGLMDELKYVDPHNASGEPDYELVGQGQIRRKRKPKKIDRLKELRKRFKKAKI